MVGDKNLMQNGIRTSYGIVGDFGELPVQGQLTSASLRTYIPGGYSSDTYNDAWGRRFRYTVYDNLPGYDSRFLSGKICSDGLDGVSGNSDDICLDIPVSEVAPTHRIQGNFVFANTLASYSSARFEVSFKSPNDHSGESIVQSGCKTKIGAAFPNFTTLFSNSGVPINLPIGKATIKAKAYKNLNCPEPPTANSGTMDFFVSDNISRLLLNLPPIP
jgi:hypothetical protein